MRWQESQNETIRFSKQLLLWGFLFLISACGGQKGFQSASLDMDPTPPAQQKATPTVDDFFAMDPYQIDTGKAKVQIGYLKTESMSVFFDPKTRGFTIQGESSMVDAKTKNRTSYQFRLAGEANSEGFADLFPIEKEKKSSQETPHFRAKVTCLTLKENGQYDCDSAVIDLLVRFRGVLHTDQLETTVLDAGSPLTVTDPVKGPTAPDKKKAPGSLGDNSGVPDGRYIGRIWEDLWGMFDEAPEKEDVPGVTGPDGAGSKKNPPPEKSPAAGLELAGTKPCVNNMTVMKNGNTRPCNQASFNSKTKVGSLQNATSLLERVSGSKENIGLIISNQDRKRYYGTFELVELLVRMGLKASSYSTPFKFIVGDISIQEGGTPKGSSHKSHQCGLDADLRVPLRPAKKKEDEGIDMVDANGKISYRFPVDKAWVILKHAVNDSGVRVNWILTDQVVKDALCNFAQKNGELRGPEKVRATETLRRIAHWDDHEDHFHLNIACTPDNIRCRDEKVNLPEGTNCPTN